MSEGVAIHDLVYEDGKPADYVITDVNDAYESIIGIKKSGDLYCKRTLRSLTSSVSGDLFKCCTFRESSKYRGLLSPF